MALSPDSYNDILVLRMRHFVLVLVVNTDTYFCCVILMLLSFCNAQRLSKEIII